MSNQRMPEIVIGDSTTRHKSQVSVGVATRQLDPPDSAEEELADRAKNMPEAPRCPAPSHHQNLLNCIMCYIVYYYLYSILSILHNML